MLPVLHDNSNTNAMSTDLNNQNFEGLELIPTLFTLISKMSLKLAVIEKTITTILHSQPTKQTYTVKDLVETYGFSRQTVYNNPWLMPNFGISDFPDIKKRVWRLETWVAWMEVSPGERKAQWGALPIKEREAILKSITRDKVA